MAELIGDELGIDTGLSREAGMRAPHDLKGRPFQAMGFRRGLMNQRHALSRPNGVVGFAEGNTQLSGPAGDCCLRQALRRRRVLDETAT